jgi:hypothetical protein
MSTELMAPVRQNPTWAQNTEFHVKIDVDTFGRIGGGVDDFENTCM